MHKKSETFGRSSHLAGTTVDDTKRLEVRDLGSKRSEASKFEEQVVGSRMSKSSAKLMLLQQMKSQIDAMSDRMSSFETTVTSRIDVLEGNFNALESKMSSVPIGTNPLKYDSQ